jgi:acetyl esterase/lipase
MKNWPAVRVAGVCLLGAIWLSAGPAVRKAAAAEQKHETPKYEVEIHRNIAYYEGKDADRVKHKLDLYLPKGKTGYPVVLFVHGGAWVMGDRNFFGMYEALGKMFARHGVGAAVTSYRLSPKVKHPEHVKDVARAFAWVHRNIKKYGGRPDQLFVCGHSAGGHLAALLSTDESYLKAEGLTLKDVKGALPISGVYAIPGNLLTEVFGKDPAVRKQAGPLNCVRAGCPPFLIIYADRDFPFMDVGAEQFCKALKAKRVPADTLKVTKRNHIDIIIRMTRDGDPCGQAVLDFIARHTRS